ncbi:hypothetical protein FHG87_013044 [Trinorchestia longiramus]|nr:hypothetical protein FHG87_013044 [Trinorchestia longiramus]
MLQAQKVLLPVNHVFSDGNTQGAAGHSLIVDAATAAEVPVLVFGYSYQYTDIAEQRPLQYNRLCPPEDYLWGRRAVTRVTRYIPRQGKQPSTVALKPKPAPGTYVRHITKDPLMLFKKSITDGLVRGPDAPVSDNQNFISSVLDVKREACSNVYMRGCTLSVAPSCMDSEHPQYPVDVPACCLMFDVARSSVDYAINDFCTMRPRCALTIMSRFHKLM